MAAGISALFHNTTGSGNVAAGADALSASSTASDNVAVGQSALLGNVSGASNVAVGANALAKVRGRRNIALGPDAGANVSGVRSDNIEIGNKGLGTDAATTRIGTEGTQTRAFMAGISGTSIAGPTKTLVVNPSGQLGTATAAKASDLEQLMETVKRQQRQIERLREQAKGG
jgi:trimeric autotransporter adhesin